MELEERMEEQEERMDKHEEGIQEDGKIMEENDEKMVEDKAENVFSVRAHGTKYAVGENIKFDSFNAAALEVKLLDKGPKVGAKKRGRPRKITIDRAQMTKDELIEILSTKELLK